MIIHACDHPVLIFYYLVDFLLVSCFSRIIITGCSSTRKTQNPQSLTVNFLDFISKCHFPENVLFLVLFKLVSFYLAFFPCIYFPTYLFLTISSQGGNFHLKVGGAKSSGNAGDPMLGVAVSGGYNNHPNHNHKVGGGQK